MVVKFTPTGTTSSIVNYICDNSTADEKMIMSGDPSLTKKIIDNSNFSNNYYHIILAEDKELSYDHWRVIYDEFMNEFMIGIDKDEYNVLAVLHDNKHIHIAIPKMNLMTGTGHKLYMDSIDRDRVNLIRDLINKTDFTENGLEEIKLSNPVKQELNTNEKSNRLDEINQYREKHDNRNPFEGLGISSTKEKNSSIAKVKNYVSKQSSLYNNMNELKDHILNLKSVQKIGYDTKFKTKKNPQGIYATVIIKGKNIRVPLKELNEELWKNNQYRPILKQYTKETIRKELDIKNDRRIKFINSSRPKLKANNKLDFNNTGMTVKDSINSIKKENNDIEDILNKKKKNIKYKDAEDKPFNKTIKSTGTLEDTLMEKKAINIDDFSSIDSDKGHAESYTSSFIKFDIKKYDVSLKPSNESIIKENKFTTRLQESYKDHIPWLKENIDLGKYLQNHGVEVTQNGDNNYWMKSPFREETRPSFSTFYNEAKKTWLYKDHSTGEIGSILDLHCKLHNTDVKTSIKELSKENYRNNIESTVIAKTNKEIELSYLKEKEIKDNRLKKYLKDRGITKYPKQLLQLEEKTILKGKDMTFKYVAFKNDSNSYAVRNEYFKGNKGTNDITTIDNGAKNTVIVEGTFDMLSLYQIYGNKINYKILNSTSNMNKLNLDPNQNHVLALDNDESGIETTSKILKAYNDLDFKITLPKNGDWNEDLNNEGNIVLKQYSRREFEEQLKRFKETQLNHNR